MSEAPIPFSSGSCEVPAPRGADLPASVRLARRLALRRLGALREGALVLEEPGAGPQRFGASEGDAVRVRVHDPALWTALAGGGLVGAAGSYARGEWDCEDLAGLVRLFLRNPRTMDGVEGGVARLAALARAGRHLLRRNHRAGARRNIAAHYDLGNDFFAAFLDPSMTYSCALFEREGLDLEAAQHAKYRRIVDKLRVGAGDHVLEIGSGWGGFAIHAARTTGCRVTTTTISRRQYEEARERVARAGLADRVEVLFEDYRDLRGTYDKLVSIEMIEAVGAEYFDAYFRACAARLAPHGAMALQAITIADQHYERARRSVDFIKRWIFPGGCLPSVEAMARSVARTPDLRIVHLEDWTPHYPETLRRWRARFRAARPSIRAMGYDPFLLRLWEFYLGYCEGGFEERHIGLVQLVLARGGGRVPAPRGRPGRAA
ncbi:MAG: cyclopropane-fatty-acyl-phospholipid synthase family protein [Myxococcota bacterium]|nr:cyclopropane-fatty-acyl-phospholipid synthase family protein [Myxococcota bacterium]